MLWARAEHYLPPWAATQHSLFETGKLYPVELVKIKNNTLCSRKRKARFKQLKHTKRYVMYCVTERGERERIGVRCENSKKVIYHLTDRMYHPLFTFLQGE